MQHFKSSLAKIIEKSSKSIVNNSCIEGSVCAAY